MITEMFMSVSCCCTWWRRELVMIVIWLWCMWWHLVVPEVWRWWSMLIRWVWVFISVSGTMGCSTLIGLLLVCLLLLVMVMMHARGGWMLVEGWWCSLIELRILIVILGWEERRRLSISRSRVGHWWLVIVFRVLMMFMHWRNIRSRGSWSWSWEATRLILRRGDRELGAIVNLLL